MSQFFKSLWIPNLLHVTVVETWPCSRVKDGVHYFVQVGGVLKEKLADLLLGYGGLGKWAMTSKQEHMENLDLVRDSHCFAASGNETTWPRRERVVDIFGKDYLVHVGASAIDSALTY